MMNKTPESVRKMSKRAKLSKILRSFRHNDDQSSPDLSDDSPQSITQIAPTPLLSGERHLEFRSELNDCALTPDGKLFCVALDNRSSTSQFRTSELSNESVKIHNYSNTSVRSTYSGHTASVQACALSTDGTVASSADYEGHISLWKTNTGREASSFSAHWGPVFDIDLTPASDLLVSVGADSMVKMWDVNAGACRRQFLGHSYDVYSCAVSTSGKDILSAGADGKLILWDERQKEPRDIVTAHGRKRVSYCAVDRFWRQFVTTGFDSHVRLWDMRLVQPIHSVFVQNSNLYGCDITGSGSRFVACGENGTLQVWSSADLKITESLTGHNPRLRVARCSISDDATRVVSVGHDCAAWLFNLRTPSADEDPLDLTSDDKTVQPDCATSALYCNYMNGNERLSPSKVVNALKSDHTRGNTPNLSEIYFGHALAMTIIKSGESFSNDLLGGVAFSETFFYEHLYHKLSQLMTTDKEKDFGHLMLFDAKENGLLTAGDIRSIIGDARTLNVVDTKLSHLKNVFAEVCVQVASRLDKLENRVDILKDDLRQLRQDVDEIEEKLDRQAKLHRWASIVKFGLSCIPIAGSFAMGFVDASAELFLSFDLETIVETITGIVGATSQLAVDLKRDNAICKDYASFSNDRNDVEKELKCVQLVRLIMSPNFLDQIPPGEGAVVRATVESHFGYDVQSLSGYTRSVFEDYLDVLKSHNSARSSTSHMPSM